MDIIGTKNTIVYYPTEYLINGGPPFTTLGCPHVELEHDDIDVPIRLVYNTETKFFGWAMLDRLLMESKEPKDLARFITDYVEGFQEFVKDQETVEVVEDGDA